MLKLISRQNRVKHLVILLGVAILVWNLIMYRKLSRNKITLSTTQEKELLFRLDDLEQKLLRQIEENGELLEKLQRANPFPYLPRGSRENYLPVLVMACNRVSVNRALDKLIQYRSPPARFPIVVSQDCGHQQTADVINTYVVPHNITHIKQPDLSDIQVPPAHVKLVNYYKVSRHYKWALEQMFMVFNFSAVIIVEDDLEVAPDFYEYFSAVYPLLKNDSSLWCISAWNDNGMGGKISGDSALLHRTDFFPGLGWLLDKELWMELRSKWPATFWDDWMRHADQRKGRQCIRPEICRTKTFGEKGVSNGAFYAKYLQHIILNSEFVPFSKLDLSYLEKDKYNATFTSKVYSAPLFSSADVLSGARPNDTVVRLEYTDKNSYVNVARQFGIMEDFKSGVPRVGYNGVVTFTFKGRRVYIAPPSPWTGYNPSWN
ncbi:unnamed protein product [Lymnaea stagnalis]|uniref:Alpha-1,3-mannosyl-glycoprotein 2-beta-N-acetylglucosaminyltransferase n=1 Tax=Lymnaea stagnalis TaxID=6523 RepID=A0AAV2I8N7_LYMST